MADDNSVDWGAVDAQLKQKAGQWYDTSMLGDVQRNAAAGQAGNQATQATVDDWVNRVSNKAQLRGSNESNSTYQADGQGGVTVGPTGKVNNPNGDGPSTLGTNNGSNGGSTNATTAAWSQATPTVDPALKAQQDDLYATLMDRAKQGTAVDRNDPNIRQQADAYNANQDRAGRNFLSDQAESSGPYANPTGQQRMVAEKTGQAEGSFEADLIGQEMTAKRDEIQQALTQAGTMLTSEQQMDLQKQLAVMNQAIQNRQIDTTATANKNTYDLGLRNIGLNDWGQQMYYDAVNSGRLG